jgi:hypothetical protein
MMWLPRMTIPLLLEVTSETRVRVPLGIAAVMKGYRGPRDIVSRECSNFSSALGHFCFWGTSR